MSTTPEERDSILQRALAAVKDLRGRLENVEAAGREPVAVVGMACRFPGSENSAEGFWRLLREGGDAVVEVPSARWDPQAWFDPRPEIPGKMYTRQGGFLDEVDSFDAGFFGIAPREALRMDPQHRLLLEVAWEALEDAGQVAEALEGSAAGVFVGISTADYAQRLRSGGAGELGPYDATGNSLNAAAGRLSYVLGLRGPCMAVDAACASSLVSVHLACQSLRGRECDLALAGGVNLILGPDAHLAMCRARALAADGRCKTFDAGADGYGRGEGCGVVVLKRLSDAVAQSDRILALLLGSAVSHDGRSSGLTVPNGQAQQGVIRAALANAGIDPREVGYVEAHGTGTSLGDPIEVRALAAVLGPGRPADRPLVLGAVKTNIGHLEAAAGIAGLIKTVLAVRYGEIPPHLHLRTINPEIDLATIPAVIPAARTPWPAGAQRRVAGVSGFGLSGTIAHVVVAEAPAETEKAPAGEGPWAVPVSGRSEEALRELARRYAEAAEAAKDAPDPEAFAYTAGVRRTHHEHRGVAVGHTAEELAGRLLSLARGEKAPGVARGVAVPGVRKKLAFVFPGQGGQWPGMALDLARREEVFGAALERCGRALHGYLEGSLWDVLGGEELGEGGRIEVVQPALFAVQVALAELWRSLGVEPDAVIGHSMGEVAAACVAGALSLEDGARVIGLRSRLMSRLKGRGAMAVVELPLAQARQEAARIRGIAVAASNGPRSTVLSGEREPLAELLEQLGRRDVFCRWVKVDMASHSPQVEELRNELLAGLGDLRPRRGSVPLVSTVLGERISGEQCGAEYWVSNLRQPVLFAPMVERLLAEGFGRFVELSPHPTLTLSMEETLREHGGGVVVPSLRREEDGREVMLASLGALWANGHPVEWARLHPRGGRCIALPHYPWQHERFWCEGGAAESPLARRALSPSDPILGERLGSPALADAVFESRMSVESRPFVADHRIDGEVVVPGACHLALALAAAREVLGAAPWTVEDVRFPHALVLPDEGSRPLQVIAGRDGSFSIVSLADGPPSEAGAWELHATGRLGREPEYDAGGLAFAAIRSRCTRDESGEAFYEAMAAAGYHLGSTFRWIESAAHRPGEALAYLREARPEDGAEGWPLFPGLLDSCFQLVALTALEEGLARLAGSDELYVPVGVTRLRLGRAVPPAWCHVALRPAEPAQPDVITADIRIADSQGEVVADVVFRGKRVSREAFLHGVARREPEPFFTLEWRPLPPSAPAAPAAPAADDAWLLLTDRRGIGEALRRRLEARGEECATAAPGTDPAALLRETFGDGRRCRGIVDFRSLDALETAGLEEAVLLECHGVVSLVQACAAAGWRDAPRLWIVTAGARSVGETPEPVAVAQAPVWGLARSLVHEHPELRCACVDLGAEPAEADMDALADEILADSAEDQVALRDGARFAARLVRSPLEPTAAAQGPTAPAGETPFRVETLAQGTLEALVLRAASRRDPGPEDVEIEVRAAGLNFVDVLSALGVRPDRVDGPVQFGGECAGVVTRIGEAVEGLKVGDEVVSMAPHAFGRYVTVAGRFAVPKPPRLSFEQAATLPIAYMTAWWAMHHLGRLERGESILIHAATGGVGLAALQIARLQGLTVFATAGSPEKREMLRGLGVAGVMDSRSLTFAEEVREATSGRGVDAVLNCLTGEAVAKGVAALAPHGRFLEIGKRDIYENRPLALFPFHRNLSYFAVDLIRMYSDRPETTAALLREVVDLVGTGVLEPLPLLALPISRVQEGFRLMAQAKHTGKIVFTLPDPEARVLAGDPAADGAVRADGTYLITGGLGGLGLAVARWMVEQGARHLALLGRSAPSAEAREAIAGLERGGARVLVLEADVSQLDELRAALGAVDAALPPLRGVVHAAGSLDDGLLLQLDADRIRRVLAPKLGAWNLHTLTAGRPLDFFLLFSGAAAVLGSPGQAHYAAANAFLDALAHHRRARGLPALAIDWGPWSDVGLAARPDRGGRLALRGVGSLSPAQGTAALQRLLGCALPQVAVMPLDLRQCFQSYPALAAAPLFAELRMETEGEGKTEEAPFRRQLAAAEAAARTGLLQEHVRQQVAEVLGLAPARLELDRPLGSLGLDSLMTLELRNRLERSLGLTLSATLVWNHPTLAALAEHLSRRMGLLGETAQQDPKETERTAAAESIAAMKDDEAEEALAEMLSQVEALTAS